MFFLLRIIFYCLLFLFLLPSFEIIYYYHFGTVTNSDALYPYLFIKDFNTNLHQISGWVTPPSHCLFPDLGFMFLLQLIIDNIYWIHWAFAFFCFLSIIYVMRMLSLSWSIALVTALCFLKLGELYPRDWGQFFLPSFHGTEFFLLALNLHLLRGREILTFGKGILIGITLALSIFSELWFFVHSFIPLILYVLISKKYDLKSLLLMIFAGLGSYQLLLNLQKKIGIGSFQPKQFPIKESLQSLQEILKNEPISLFERIAFVPGNLPLRELLIPSFWILLLFTIYRLWKNQKDPKILLLPLSMLGGMIFIQIGNLEVNARHFYFLPASIIGMFFFNLGSFSFLKKITTLALFLMIVLSSNRFLLDPNLTREIEISKSLHSERITCTIQTWQTWGKSRGASTYWPVKYMRAFSTEQINLIPFTNDGVYYPWVHNLKWDSEYSNPVPKQLDWGIVSANEDLLFGRVGKEFRICADWKLIRTKE